MAGRKKFKLIQIWRGTRRSFYSGFAQPEDKL
jgi:hypothetical protein